MTDEVVCDVCYGKPTRGTCYKCGGRGRIPINWSRPRRALPMRSRNIRLLWDVLFYISLIGIVFMAAYEVFGWIARMK